MSVCIFKKNGECVLFYLFFNLSMVGSYSSLLLLAPPPFPVSLQPIQPLLLLLNDLSLDSSANIHKYKYITSALMMRM